MRRALPFLTLALAVVGAPPAHGATTVVEGPAATGTKTVTAVTTPDDPAAAALGVEVAESVQFGEVVYSPASSPPSSLRTLSCSAVATGASAPELDCFLRSRFSGRIIRPSGGTSTPASATKTLVSQQIAGDRLEVCFSTRVLLRDGVTTFTTPLTCREAF
jgi:hypothetical protein